MAAIFEENILIIKNPVSNAEISRIDITNSKEFEILSDEVVQYKDWSLLSVKKRCSYISLLRKAIVKHQSELESIIKSETGKNDFDIFIEVFTMLEHLKQMPKIARSALKSSHRNTGIMKSKKAYVLYEPLGVAGIIAPWNYPLATPIGSSMQALISGNNVILKPSEHTPLTSMYIKDLWDKYVGFNKAFNIINGGGDVGRMIVESSSIDVLCFTGSTKVGKMIAKQCAESLKPIILELGGKDPLIILKDADINRTVEAVLFGGLGNAGQTCISVEEVFIESEVFDQYVTCLSDKIRKLSSGDDSSSQIGSMIVGENFNKVMAHINDIDDKSKIISGEASSKGMFIAPTLIVDPVDTSRVVNEETFGPIISLRPFIDELDLITKVHKTGYGLAGSIFGRDKKRIKKIISQLKIGNVSVNDVMTHYGIASLPFGGEGQSGLGRLHGREGLRSLSRTKSIVENRFSFIKDPWWFSRPKFVENILKKAVKLLYR